MILFLLYFSCKALDYGTCKELKCSSGPSRKECIKEESDHVLISPCVDGLKCDNSLLNSESESWQTVMCTSEELEKDLCEDYDGNLYTGQVCCVSPNCLSDQCTNDRCEGTDDGDKCDIDEECNPDYYCDGKCKGSVEEGCERDNMCKAGFGCLDEDCVQFHSLELGENADRGIFCKTGYIYNGKCDAIVAFSDGKNLGDELVCQIGATCIYYTYNENEKFDEGACLCAGDKSATTGYCGVYADKSTQIQKFYEAIVYDSSKCTGNLSHTDDPDQLYECESISAKERDYNKYMINRFKYFNLYKSTIIDHCARPQGIFNPWYQTSEYFSFGQELLLSLVFAIIN